MKTGIFWYKNLKFRYKIQLLCFIVSLIPVILLGAFCTIQSRRLLVSQEKTNINSILDQAASSLDHYLSLQESIITTLAWDEAIQSAVDKSYSSNYEMFLANSEVFDSKFLMIQAMHPEIEGITLYTQTNLFPHGTTLKQLSDLEGYSWYEDALSAQKPFYIFDRDNGKFILVYLLPCSFYKNVMTIDLSYDYAFSGYKSLFEDDYAVGIYDGAGELIFDHSSFTDAPADDFFDRDLASTLSKDVGPEYFREVSGEDAHGWKIMVYRPLEFITSSANSFILVVMGMIALCIVSMIYLGVVLSKYLVEPLEKLADNMDRISADNFTVTVESRDNDEIAKLIGAFDNMAKRLESTIYELYVNKLAKQEYRLQMLQSQINPHFLYNCLSMINSKAILAGQTEISSIALQLSTFYRTTLNKGHNTTRLADEWKNTLSYLEIQRMLHSDSFEFSYDVDESLFECRIINLIIQPLVENAIVHGIRYIDSENYVGKIRINIRRDEGNILITVEDNGCGMDRNTLDNILTAQTKGYGIRNVDQRIKLYFGQEYGITYESEPGAGTTACIRLPINE
ncbi:MAG: sensor histidine kinase [Butyrivibrio sp.]|nr:sensor histidine kinase [Butyrivibrio sp.]